VFAGGLPEKWLLSHLFDLQAVCQKNSFYLISVICRRFARKMAFISYLWFAGGLPQKWPRYHIRDLQAVCQKNGFYLISVICWRFVTKMVFISSL